MIKAVFFDIDGTLVSFETHTIPESTIHAINKLKEQDIKVFIATGRPYIQIPNLYGLKFDGLITLNGACCLLEGGKVIYQHPIAKSDIEAIVQYLDTEEVFPCAFMCHDQVYINQVSQSVKDMHQLVNVPVPQVADFHTLVDEKVLQINIFVDESKEEELMKNVFLNCHSSRWNPLFADVNALGNNKQTGIDKMLEHFQINVSETMSFGDGGNDIPMLKHTAIGVAMGNAKEEVKQFADYITESVDNNGISKALDHFIFQI